MFLGSILSRSSSVVPLARKFWVKDTGFENLTQLIAHDDASKATIYAVSSKYYALAAFAALFEFMKLKMQAVFPINSLKIRYIPLEGERLAIDRSVFS